MDDRKPTKEPFQERSDKLSTPENPAILPPELLFRLAAQIEESAAHFTNIPASGLHLSRYIE